MTQRPRGTSGRRTSEQQRNLTASSSIGTSQVRGPDSQRQGENPRQETPRGSPRQKVRRDTSGSQIAGQRQDGKPTTHQPPRESESRQTDRQNRQQPPHRSDTSAGESPTQRYAVVRGPVRCPPIRHLVVRVRVRVRPLCPPKRPHGPGKHQPGLQCAQT